MSSDDLLYEMIYGLIFFWKGTFVGDNFLVVGFDFII